MSDHPEIEEEKLEAIREYLKAFDLLNLFQDILVGQIEHYQMKYPQLPEEFWNKAFQEPNYEDFLKHIIPIYDKYYTAEELAALTEFFSTEVGKKYIETEPLTAKMTRAVIDHMSNVFENKVMEAVGEGE